MNVTTENLEPLHRILRIHLDEADYRPAFDKAIKDLSKKVNVPGFRVGHVPPGLLRKQYGDSILAEELNRAVNGQLNNYLKENNLQLLGDPLPADSERITLDYTQPKEYDFAYELGIRPEIDLTASMNKEKTFTRYRIPAKPEEIEEEITRLRRRYGQRNEIESAGPDDVIYAHLHELNTDGNEKEGGIHTDTFFNMQMLSEEGKTLFATWKKEEEHNIPDLFAVFQQEKDKVVTNILHADGKDEQLLAHISPQFGCRITKIVRLEPAEMDAKFFEAVSSEYGAVESEEALREKIAASVRAHNDRITEVRLENEIFKFLGDTTPVPLPEVFLRKWFKASSEKESADENFESEFQTFTDKLKQTLIFQKIQADHNLEVGKEEIIGEAVDTVRMSYGQLGEDFVTYVAKNQLKEKSFIENMHDRVLQKKFFEVLKGYVNIRDEEISAEAYNERFTEKETYANQQ